MKRLKFKKPFNGFGNALKLIPENYKIEGKEFEMTDGNETYKIKWVGNKGKILSASDNKLIKEDITRLKQLMGYKSSDTLGLLEGKDRVKETQLLRECIGGEGIKEENGGYDETYSTAYEWFYNFGDENFRTQLINKNISDVHSFKRALETNPTLLYYLANEIKKSSLYNRASNNFLDTQLGQKLISNLGLSEPKDNFDDGELERDYRAIEYGINPTDLG